MTDRAPAPASTGAEEAVDAYIRDAPDEARAVVWRLADLYGVTTDTDDA